MTDKIDTREYEKNQCVADKKHKNIEAECIAKIKNTMDLKEKTCEMLQSVESWNFNMFDFANETENQPLKYISHYVFYRHDLLRKFDISPKVFDRFIVAIETGYNSYNNPYHNNVHAADVVQTLNVILFETKLITWLNDLEIFIILFAGIIHDYDHTGKTNSFLVATASDLALIYNDRSVQENHHISATFSLLREDRYNVLSSLPKEKYRLFRSLVIEIILSTDMAFHFRILKDIQSRIKSFEYKALKSKALSLLLHASDISNAFKKYPLNIRWIELVYQEFFAQGDLERELKLPITGLCDRETVIIAETQINFLDFVCKPTYRTLIDLSNFILKAVGKKRGKQCKIRMWWLQNFEENKKKYKEEMKSGQQSTVTEETHRNSV